MKELSTLQLNNETLTMLTVLKECDAHKKSIYKQLECGIIESVEAVNEIDMITAKEKRLKKTLVLKAHTTEDGKPRKIKYLEAKNLWQTIMPDGKRICSKTEEGLIDKLFEHYHLTIKKTTIRDLFQEALTEKQQTEDVADDTIRQYEYAYKRSISEELGKTDITTISGTDLQKYTLNLVKTTELTKSAFLEYKGVLNLTFDYAIRNEIITANPVATINNKKYYKSCKQKASSPKDNILSEEEIKLVIATVRRYMTHKTYNGYFINGYAILLAIETGMRAGELCSLKWSDVMEKSLHIHSQQLNKKAKGGKTYYYVPWTKNEKGEVKGGRMYPLTKAIRDILDELKALQEERGISSEYIFCHEDGEWIKTDAYETCLRRMMTSLKLKVTHNHAFRKTLNSNVFIKKHNLPVSVRAELLGHSIATNEKHYSFTGTDTNWDALCKTLNEEDEKEVSPRSHLEIVRFDKEKTLESA